jgi:hypothetical protein
MEQEEIDELLENSTRQLREAGANMRCAEVTKLLTGLFFAVRDGKKGGHKLYSHPGLSGFPGSSFNCGHGKNPEIKRSYIRNILSIITEYEDQLKEYLRGMKK